MSVRTAEEYLASPLRKARVATIANAAVNGTVVAPTAVELAAVGATGANYYRVQILLLNGDKGVNSVRFDFGQTGTFTEESETGTENGNVLSRPIPIDLDTDWTVVDQTTDAASAIANAAGAFLAVLVPVLP